MISVILIVFILIIGTFLIKQSEKDNPKKIFHVYAQKGKWYRVKYMAMSCLLFFRRLKFYIHGKDKIYKIEDLDKLQTLSSHELAFDAVFFQGVSQSGIYLCIGIERRQAGKIALVLYIVHPDYGLLEHQELPNSIVDADIKDSCLQKNYSGGGLTLTPIKPMKKWNLIYRGSMKLQNDPQKKVDVNLEVEWTSTYDYYFFEIDVPISVFAKAIATESWSGKRFQNLKDAHQKHYEQMGEVNGVLQINGKTTSLDNIAGFRDHSFGFKRDWSLIHRYIFNTYFLSDGTQIELAVISQPVTTSHLEMGFVNHPNGKLDPIDSIDLRLYDTAEDGILPKELNFTFKAGGVTYHVHMEFVIDAQYYKGLSLEAIVNQRFHKCVINNVCGKGITEFTYNRKLLK